MELNIEQQGLDELEKKMKAVTFDAKKKGGRFALRKAAHVVRDAAKKSAQRLDDPSTSNSIADNVSVRWNGRLFKKTENLGFRIGILGGARDYSAYGEISTKNASKNPGGDTFYWRFLEFGTSEIPATPFLRPALADNAAAAQGEFVKQYKKALDRAIKKGRVR